MSDSQVITNPQPSRSGGTPASHEELTAEHVFSPLSVQQFVDQHWGRRHLVLHRGAADHYGPLFGFADVDHYLALAGRSADSWLSLGQGGKVNQRLRIQDVDVRDLYSAVHGGATILLESTDRHWPPTARLADVVGEALGARVKVNVYMTPPGQQGAPVHPDVQDVFVLQMAGAKQWDIYDHRAYEAVETLEHLDDLAYSRPPLPAEPSLLEHTLLEPGDLLYLPRGVLHRAVAPSDRPSLHLTVCVTPTYWVDLLKVIAEAASLEHRELAEALPPDFTDDPAVRQRLLDQLPALLERLTSEAVLERATAVFGKIRDRKTTNPGDGQFEQLLRIEEVTLDTLVERRRGRRPQVETTSDGVRLRFGPQHVQGAAALEPAFGFVRDRHRFRVADLPDVLSGPSKVVLVKRLIREGLLRARLDPRST